MKLNQDKCFLLIYGYKHENIWVQNGEEIIWEKNKPVTTTLLIIFWNFKMF